MLLILLLEFFGNTFEIFYLNTQLCLVFEKLEFGEKICSLPERRPEDGIEMSQFGDSGTSLIPVVHYASH